MFLEVENFFRKCMADDPQKSVAVAAIHTLLEYMKVSAGKRQTDEMVAMC